MITNVYGVLSLLSSGNFANYGSGIATTTIHNGGLLSMSTGAAFFGTKVVIEGGATFVSGIKVVSFCGSSLTLLYNATHKAMIGAGSQPIEIVTWTYNGHTSNVTLGGATLDVVSYEPLDSLQGNNYTILTADSGSSISGQYGALQFNGVNTSIPYTVSYDPNSSSITSVNLIFSPTTSSPTYAPSLEPSLPPSETPTTEPTLKLSALPSSTPSLSSSNSPSLLPTYVPSLKLTLAPTFEPSLLPTSIPSAIATGVASLIPTAATMINNITNYNARYPADSLNSAGYLALLSLVIFTIPFFKFHPSILREIFCPE
jgi:hypothetical protein